MPSTEQVREESGSGFLGSVSDEGRAGDFHWPLGKIPLFPCASIGYERRVSLVIGGTLRTAPTFGKPVAGALKKLRAERTEAHWNDRHHHDCQPKGRSRKNHHSD